ncbi:ATP-binding protein [Anaerorudis cellulosivorans]|uniref:DNA polymerase III subunit n=1 Tax=Anaerorudis cellulosivorans TaxID=3397862 RepID=UPI00221EDCF0|nr:DNA polymerase III subunit [Seramator thermalis]MCW1735679.1 DNA polymerase III subunit [Seramator thermalis]
MYFKDIIGLRDIKKHLLESEQKGFVSHAYLFYGPEGVGKLPLAIAYARYLNCLHPQVGDACGKCPSCLKFNKLAHPDLHFAFPVIKSKVSDEYLPQWRSFLSQHTYFNLNDWLNFIDAQNAQGIIYAKESEEIIRKLSLKIYEAKYRIMIVWLPEKMHEVCANKLLKMIEEPPVNTVFLLVSEELDGVLPTIQSRCQLVHVNAIENDEMVDAIESKYCLAEKDALSVVHIANGSFTKAMKIIESTDETKYFFDLFKTMMRASVSRNIKNIKAIANEIAGIGREMQKSYVLYCLRMFREYFINNLHEPQMVYLNSEEAEFGIRFSPFINEQNIEKLNDEFSLAYRQIEQNGNAKIIFLDLCLKITVLLLN